MSAQDFGKLIASGWIATGIAVGTESARDAGRALWRPAAGDDGNRELEPWTDAFNQARRGP